MNVNIDSGANIDQSKLNLAITNSEVSSGTFANITGIGAQTQDLDMNGNHIKNTSSSNGGHVTFEDNIDMRTYNIQGIDQLIFSSGTSSDSPNWDHTNDYGMEIYGGTTDLGLMYAVPNDKQFYWFENGGIIMQLSDTELDVGDKYIEFGDISSPSNPNANKIRLFCDSGNSDKLSVKHSDGSVTDLESGGGGGVQLSDNNTWTGTNKFTQHVTLGNGDNLLPEVDVGSNLGDSTHAFSLVYFRNLFLDDPNVWIKYVSGDMVLNTKSGNDIIFKEDDTTFFYLDGGNNDVRFSKEVEFNADVRMDGGNVFRSQNGVEIGYYVTDTTASTGTQGTQQLPYWENTTKQTSQQSNTTLDSKFGNQTGCSGLQYDSSENAGSGKYRLWVKAEGSGTGSGKWIATELY